jgi:hypothetical protein
MRPAFEVATILDRHWEKAHEELKLNGWQWRTLSAIRRCRSAAMGGHIDQCDQCGHLQISYNSCRNRHCPKCQGHQREAWMEARRADLLPVPYFHVVFTLPGAVNPLCLYKPAGVYNPLFAAAWSSIKSFAADPEFLGAGTGMICILHTWGQTLTLHPHLHCIIPAGGITAAGYWKRTRNEGKFLFPVKALSKLFRARYVAALRKTFPEKEKDFFEGLFKTSWVVYAKRPFGGPQQVIEYLGRYTHKIAISNHRITAIQPDTVNFAYKDYRDESGKKEMSLSAVEFIRRFAMHILPRAFVRIRHYGLLSCKLKKEALSQIRIQLKQNKPAIIAEKLHPLHAQIGYPCPCCKKGTMLRMLDFDYRGPPAEVVWQTGCTNGSKSLPLKNTV